MNIIKKIQSVPENLKNFSFFKFFRCEFSLRKSGFTLVEALVAISILMVAIAGPMTIAQRGLSTAVLSKDQMTASFLAQDGLEAVKNIRDQVVLSSVPGDTNWLLGLDNCICDDSGLGNMCDLNNLSVAKYCNIDTTASDWSVAIEPKNNPSPHDNPLNFMTDNTTGFFVKYGLLPTSGLTATASKFSRYINIKKSSDNLNEALVRVRIVWSSPLGLQNIEVKNFIYNYSENIQ